MKIVFLDEQIQNKKLEIFYKKNCFPMPSAKNRFQILNLHPKKIVFK